MTAARRGFFLFPGADNCFSAGYNGYCNYWCDDDRMGGFWLKRSGEALKSFVRSKRNCRCRLFAHWTKHGEDDVILVVQLLCIYVCSRILYDR